MKSRDELLDRIEHVEQQLAALSLRDTSSSMSASNLTVQQLQVLTILWAGGPIPASAIATALGTGAPAATALVDRLVRRGLLERTDAPNDRRVRLINLADPGRALIDELTKTARDQRRRLLNQLPHTTLLRFRDVLDDILATAADPENSAPSVERGPRT